MNSTLTSSPLPSLSPLTGTVRTSIASEAIDKAYIDSQRKWLSTAGGTRYQVLESGTGSPLQPSPVKPGTASLREAAGKHLSSIGKAPRTPYQRVLSPAAKAVLKEEMAQKLQAFMKQLQAAAPASTDTGVEQSGTGAEAGPAIAAGSSNFCLGTPKRPSTSLSTTEMVMQRPASRMARTPELPAVSRSWSGPLSALEQQQRQQQQQQQYKSSVRPASRLGLMSRLATPMLNSAVTKPTMLTAGGGRAEVWTNTVSTSAPASPKQHQESQALTDASRRPGLTPARFRSGTGTTAATGTGSGFEKFKPSRGLVYSVFQDLDTHGEGRVTYSTFEEAALMCGIHTDQARKFFNMMDKQKQGFLTTKEWGNMEVEKQLSDFTRLYIQKTRAADGRYKGAQEIDNLYAALQLALYKLHLKNSGRSVSHERLLQAFQFIDYDKSGTLDKREVLDAFNGMGIYINDEVLEEAMNTFDKNNSGDIEYAEFIATLFPTLSKGYRMDG